MRNRLLLVLLAIVGCGPKDSGCLCTHDKKHMLSLIRDDGDTVTIRDQERVMVVSREHFAAMLGPNKATWTPDGMLVGVSMSERRR